MAKPASCHTFRHSLATHLLENRDDLSACDAQAGIRTIRELLGAKSVVSTTMINTHVLNRGGDGVDSPADRLCLEVMGRDILQADSRIDCSIRGLSR
ncbi:MAG: hypothetical protein HZB35_10900 [Nitrospirae bacterium]|nr:hypothetical protein [Nitrospirota bacterium]